MVTQARAGSQRQPEPAVLASETVGEARLWDDLACSGDRTRFGQAWLSIVARTFPSIRQATLLLASASDPAMDPVARWAVDASASDSALLSRQGQPLLEETVTSGRPASARAAELAGMVFVAVPFAMEGSPCGACLAQARIEDDVGVRRLIRHLQWAAAWVEAYLRRSSGHSGAEQGRLAADMIDFISLAIETEGVSNVARAMVSELASRFACERVALGRKGRRATRLIAMSQSADLERRGMVGEAFEAAMDEAIDQGLMLGSDDGQRFVAYAQRTLSQALDGLHVFTVPLLRSEAAFGAVTLARRGRPFDAEEMALIDAFLAPTAAILHEKALSDRSLPVLIGARAMRLVGLVIGPRHLAVKAVVLAALLLAGAGWFVTDRFLVTARGQVQGEVRRVVTAPFDGFIRSQHARAGETVAADQLLAELQDSDLTLERLRHIAQRRQYQLDHDRALARRDLAQVNISRAQVEQKDAEVELAETMLRRTQIKAPFEAVVVSGDLSQQIGRPVTRGDVLFELAPLDRYRLTLIVPELQIGSIRPGQNGLVLLTAIPEQPLPFIVESVTAVARVAEGVNGFEVLGRLTTADARIRPSMEGVAKIDAGRARVAWIWTHQFWRWLRIRAWAWLP